MTDPEHDQHRADLITRMFALLTAKAEDAAGVAADCQGCRSQLELLEGAQQLLSFAEESLTISAAIVALLARPGEESRP